MRPSKAIGVFGASLGLLGGIGFTSVLVLGQNGALPFLTDSVRSYHGEFYADDVLLYETTQKRGTEVDIPEAPTKKATTESFYTFIGWDTTGDGIPDISPNYMYYNFKANAVYLNFPLPEINLEDFDLEKLLEFLDKYNISLEDLMNFLGMDMEDLMEWLQELGLEMPTDITVTSNKTIQSPYFRTMSYGDWNTKTYKWNDPDFFDVEACLGDDSINPLDFTADKLKKSMLSSLLFDMEIDYGENVKAPYTTAVYEVRDGEANTTSDAYQNIKPKKGKYSTTGFPMAFNKTIVDVLKATSYSNIKIENAEENYRPYVYKHYLNVPDKYKNSFNVIATSKEFGSYVTTKYKKDSKDFDIVNNLYKFILDYCSFEYEDIQEYYTYPSGVDPISHFIETKKGSARHIANFATLLYRYMGVPARYVEGYLGFDSIQNPGKEVSLGFINKWGWTEVYLDGIGWVSLDCCSFFGEATEAGRGGDVSSKVPNKGPGKAGSGSANGEEGTIASFKSSDYTGTVYFRSRSFDSYELGDWRTESNYSSKTTDQYNPQAYAYFAGEDIFKDVNFEINYLVDANHGVAPEYSLVAPNNTDNSYVGSVSAGTKKKFKTKIINTNKSNLSVMSGKTSKYNSTMSNEFRAYQNYVNNEKAYTSLDLSPEIASKLQGYGSYKSIAQAMCLDAGIPINYNSSSHSIDETIALVKNYLQTRYTYNIDYNYGDECLEPLVGFVMNREGICSTFATAATVMYRYLGLKARFVVGYATNSVAGTTCYIGTNTAHAWTEVWVKDVGWMAVDCTGFESNAERRGTRDSTKPQEKGDMTYGDGPGGDGLIESTDRIKIDYVVLPQKVNYEGRAVTPGDIDADNLISIKNSDGTISSSEFKEKYRIKIFKITVQEPSEYDSYYSFSDEFSPWNAAQYKNRAKVTFAILGKNNDADMTSLFCNKDGELLSTGDYEGVSCITVATSFVFNKASIKIVTKDGETLIDEVDEYEGFSYPKFSHTGLCNPDMEIISVKDNTETHAYEVGITQNKFEVKIVVYDLGREFDVTKFYIIEYEYGDLIITDESEE